MAAITPACAVCTTAFSKGTELTHCPLCAKRFCGECYCGCPDFTFDAVFAALSRHHADVAYARGMLSRDSIGIEGDHSTAVKAEAERFHYRMSSEALAGMVRCLRLLRELQKKGQ